MTSREVRDYIYAFVKLCFGKQPTTDIEGEVRQYIESDEHLKRFVELIRNASGFFWKYAWPDMVDTRKGFTITTSSAYQVEIPENLRAKILSLPEDASCFLREHFDRGERILRDEISLIYDRFTNLLWIQGLDITTDFTRRMRAILNSMLESNGCADNSLLPLQIMEFERARKPPSKGSIADSLTDLRRLLPSGFDIENEGGWLRLVAPGDFLLIEYQT